MNETTTTDYYADAVRHLRNVTPSMADAMATLDREAPEVLRAMVAGVNALTDDSDVAAYAVTICPRMWQTRRDGAPLSAVVAAAVRKSARMVALAGWDVYGDMVDVERLMGDDGDHVPMASVMASGATGPADSQYAVTPGDVIVTALGALPVGDRTVLEGAADAFLESQRDRSGVGRSVSLLGALAWREGWTGSDAAYHAARRMTLGAVRKVSRSYALSWGAPGARPSYGANRVSIGNGFPRHERPASVIPGRAGTVVPGVTMTRRDSRTVDRVRTDAPLSGAGDVRVWDGARVVSVDVRTARRNGFPMVDALGYESRHGYAPLATLPGAPLWRAVRETTTTTTTLPGVTVGARRAMLPPDVVTSRTTLGYDASYDVPASVRTLTDAERETVSAPARNRVPVAESGDAPEARPDDSPLTGRVGASGMVLSGKRPVSPRKRPGGSTGPTIPARLSRD